MDYLLQLVDDPILSKEICTFLNTKGFECHAVFDGDLFFRELNRQAFSLYILDINVPKINGLEVCSLIRQTDKVTPILMLTAYGEIPT